MLSVIGKPIPFSLPVNGPRGQRNRRLRISGGCMTTKPATWGTIGQHNSSPCRWPGGAGAWWHAEHRRGLAVISLGFTVPPLLRMFGGVTTRCPHSSPSESRIGDGFKSTRHALRCDATLDLTATHTQPGTHLQQSGRPWQPVPLTARGMFQEKHSTWVQRTQNTGHNVQVNLPKGHMPSPAGENAWYERQPVKQITNSLMKVWSQTNPRIMGYGMLHDGRKLA